MPLLVGTGQRLSWSADSGSYRPTGDIVHDNRRSGKLRHLRLVVSPPDQLSLDGGVQLSLVPVEPQSLNSRYYTADGSINEFALRRLGRVLFPQKGVPA